MIRTILHQLWNQRRQNGWIFLELLVVSFFLWTVIDPIYVLLANRAIDRGYDPEGLYVVNIGMYDRTNGNFNPDMASDSMNLVAYRRIVRIVREQPEVDSWSISANQSFPNSDSQWYNFITLDGSNLLRTYGMKDARTGGDIQLPEQTQGKVFLSERLARLLFGTVDVVGKKVYEDDEPSEVAGVFRDFKHRDYEQPYPLIIRSLSTCIMIYTEVLIWHGCILLSSV